MRRSTTIVVVLAIVAALAAGFILGRWELELEWRTAWRPVSTPQPLNKAFEVMRPMPLSRSRQALQERGAKSPLALEAGSIGRNDADTSLHLQFRNKSACAVTRVEGVAYAFDAWGAPAAIAATGSHWMPFIVETKAVEPGGMLFHEAKLPTLETASIALAQIERVQCADGTVVEGR